MIDLLEKIYFNYIVVIEGFYFFYDDCVLELIDFSVYFDISDEVKIVWKIKCDMVERGYCYEDVFVFINVCCFDFEVYIDL